MDVDAGHYTGTGAGHASTAPYEVVAAHLGERLGGSGDPIQSCVELPAERRADRGPVLRRLPGRDFEDLGGLVDGEPRKEAQLDEPLEVGVQRGQTLERLVEVDQLPGRLLGSRQVPVQGHALPVAPALLRVPGAGGVHQDLTHRVGRESQEVAPSAHREGAGVRQPQVRLVDERGRPQRVPDLLAS